MKSRGRWRSKVNFDFLYTALFWAAGLCILFWVGLLVAGLAGELIDDETPALAREESRVLIGQEKTFY